MHPSEGLGFVGWVVVGVVLLAVVVALAFGFSHLFWFGLILTIVVFAALIQLCRAKVDAA